MLKKAGIVVAAAAAGLLAVSPLAFAGDKGGDYDHHQDGGKVTSVLNHNLNGNDVASGLLAGNNVAVPLNLCNDQIPIALVQVPLNNTTVQASDLLGGLGLGLLGDGEGVGADKGGPSDSHSCGNQADQGSEANGASQH